jgi:hypothetical protein
LVEEIEPTIVRPDEVVLFVDVDDVRCPTPVPMVKAPPRTSCV